MSFNEEQFEGKLADALKSLGPDAPASACFVMTADGNGKVAFRMAEGCEISHYQFLMAIMSSCVDMLSDVDEDGQITKNWVKEDEDDE
jgi:hypothetical protein